MIDVNFCNFFPVRHFVKTTVEVLHFILTNTSQKGKLYLQNNKECRYRICKTPFKKNFFNNPEWYVMMNNVDDGIDETNADKIDKERDYISVSVVNDSLHVVDEKGTLTMLKKIENDDDEDEKILEMHIQGKPNSHFRKNYPNGYDTSQLIPFLRKRKQEKEQEKDTLTFLHILPFILSLSENSEKMFDINSMYISALVDDTFDIRECSLFSTIYSFFPF